MNEGSTDLQIALEQGKKVLAKILRHKFQRILFWMCLALTFGMPFALFAEGMHPVLLWLPWSIYMALFLGYFFLWLRLDANNSVTIDAAIARLEERDTSMDASLVTLRNLRMQLSPPPPVATLVET